MICFVCSNLWPYSFGGAERRYYEFALELSKRGYEVRYVTYDWGPSKIPLIPLGPPPQLYDKTGRRRLSPALQFALATRRAVAKAGCKVVDVSVPYTATFLLPRERTILTLHEVWGHKWRDYFGPILGRLAEWGERRLLLWPRVVITPSRLTATRARRFRKDIYVIPFGLRLEEYLNHRGADKEYDVAIVTRLVPYKGIRDALRTLHLIRRTLKVAVVGDGPLRDEVKQEAQRSRHVFHLYPTASEEDKRCIVAKSVFFLNMSPAEGFSIATLEAVALGAYPIVLRSEYNAATELVEALGYGAIVATPEEAAAIIENNNTPDPPTSTLQQFHIKRVVDQYEEVVKRIF